jgi:hypothetical protein
LRNIAADEKKLLISLIRKKCWGGEKSEGENNIS